MRSLRVRLLVWLCLALCTLWGGVAAWMFAGMRHELRSVLDDRLIASAHMVAGIVHQFKPENASPADWGPMLNVVARDGVACEVSMLRSEVHTAPAGQASEHAPAEHVGGANEAPPALIPASPLDAPRNGKPAKAAAPQSAADDEGADHAEDDSKVLARTAGAPSFQAPLPLGFSTITKGGRPWRTYVLEEHGVRIATADRIDVREGLVHGFAYTTIFPFLVALLVSMVLMWWGVTRGLKPLESLRQELNQRPPGDDSLVTQGQQVRELAPLVQTINDMLQRVHNAIERERRWSDDAAHELRTPLTAVKTHVQVAQMAVGSAGQLQMVKNDAAQAEPGLQWHPVAQTTQWQMANEALLQAGEGVDHLQHTLEQLLLLARLDCQPVDETGAAPRATVCGTEPACALEAVEKAWDLAATAIPSGQKRLAWLPGQRQDDARLEDLHVVVPQPLLVSAVRNLIENALRYSAGPGNDSGSDRADSPVLLGLRHVQSLPLHLQQQDRPVAAAGYVQLVVADQGPGLSDEDCTLATQRFWRKTHQSHGSGLGLAIVQRIAQCSGGALQLLPLQRWSEAGEVWKLVAEREQGLVVCLYLPVQSCRSIDVEA